MTVAPTQDALENLAEELGRALAERGWRMATAESCTGGWIAQCMTAIAGSSDWFEAGLVTYSNSAKATVLGIDALVIEQHGAVSRETAIAMAVAARKVAAVEVAVAVTGVAGPGGGSPEKPVGTVWFGFAVGNQAPRAVKQHFDGTRREVRAQTVAYALTALASSLP